MLLAILPHWPTQHLILLTIVAIRSLKIGGRPCNYTDRKEKMKENPVMICIFYNLVLDAASSASNVAISASMAASLLLRLDLAAAISSITPTEKKNETNFL